MDEKCDRRARSLDRGILASLWQSVYQLIAHVMRKLDILTVAIAAILVAASIGNAVFFPVPSGPIRACPFGAIWAVVWK